MGSTEFVTWCGVLSRSYFALRIDAVRKRWSVITVLCAAALEQWRRGRSAESFGDVVEGKNSGRWGKKMQVY